MSQNFNLPSRCEDYPCCGHNDGLPCNWVAPDYHSDPHALCDHENGICEVEPDDDDDDECDELEECVTCHHPLWEHPNTQGCTHVLFVNIAELDVHCKCETFLRGR